VSPSDDMADVLAKVNNYQLVGTAVWVVFPKKKEIGVFIPGQPAKNLGSDDTLDGGAILRGFSIALRDIFGA
jgi:Uma2 family endonuclease